MGGGVSVADCLTHFPTPDPESNNRWQCSVAGLCVCVNVWTRMCTGGCAGHVNHVKEFFLHLLRVQFHSVKHLQGWVNRYRSDFGCMRCVYTNEHTVKSWKALNQIYISVYAWVIIFQRWLTCELCETIVAKRGGAVSAVWLGFVQLVFCLALTFGLDMTFIENLCGMKVLNNRLWSQTNSSCFHIWNGDFPLIKQHTYQSIEAMSVLKN